MRGQVKWFDSTRGYGFIIPADGTRDVFVHVSAVQKSRINIIDGLEVEFDVEPSRSGKGPAAVNIRAVASTV